ncbi:GtrA family protein [Streptosporangium sp. KLBMP 9127]|nr:GtrA family protein [Streptosporangium sp. KLBMP 9127]
MTDLRHLIRGSVPRIFTRYAIGSVVAAVVTEAVLLVTYGFGLLGPQAASVAAWACGATVNYVLNRRWAWRRTGRAKPLRELLPYWLAALASLGVSTWATGAADRLATTLFVSDGPRVAFVGAVFLGVYGVLFIAKFALFHYFVFADRPGADTDPETGAEPGTETGADIGADIGAGEDRRSRHQVPRTTRE